MKENSIKNEQSSIGDRIEEKYTRYLNCETDTLELTTEEAIFMLEMDESFHYVEDLLQEAYKVILSDYKRVLKENEELKILKDDIQDKRITYIDTPEFEENFISKQKVKDKIEEILNNGEYRIIFEGDAEFPDKATIITRQKYIKLEKMQELIERKNKQKED